MNEFDFIRRLRQQARSRTNSPRLISGIGDDAAVIQQSPGRDLAVTTDMLVEGVDFYPEATPARLLGHKALAVSMSDIAAMGARPVWSLVSIGLPKTIWESNFKDEVFRGYFDLADRFGVTLAGGDVSESKQIIVDSIVVGEVKAGQAVLRSRARPGDQILVTGNLGGAAAGLKLIKLGARAKRESGVGSQESVVEPLVGNPESSVNDQVSARDEASIQSLLLRQLAPQPRVGWGIVLGEERLASAMIDISDGLSSDLHHLCKESNVGATIDAAFLPLDERVKQLCGRRKLDALQLALHGGEDFELLFTVAPANVPFLPKRVDGIPISHIGEITSEPGSIRVRERNHQWDLPSGGFQHFSEASIRSH